MGALGAIESCVILGCIAIFLELMILPAFGMLFVGLGALTVAVFITFFPIMEEYQCILFGISCVLWAGLLIEIECVARYKRNKNVDHQNSDLIGEVVEVIGSDMVPGICGQVKWSGTTLNAQLSEEINMTIPVGTTLEVKYVIGNTVICSIKSKHDS